MTPSDRENRSRNALGHHLGSRDPAHIARWVRAGSTAAANPKRQCVATNKTPPFCQCRSPALIYGKHCVRHTNMKEFARIDALRRPELLHIVQTARWEPARIAAQAALRAMDRRALKFAWVYIDPRTPGSLISFAQDVDRTNCEAWLRSIGFDIHRRSSISGELPSARCIDRSLWAAARHLLKANINEAKARASVRKAHQDDARFFEKLASQLRRKGETP